MTNDQWLHDREERNDQRIYLDAFVGPVEKRDWRRTTAVPVGVVGFESVGVIVDVVAAQLPNRSLLLSPTPFVFEAPRVWWESNPSPAARHRPRKLSSTSRRAR